MARWKELLGMARSPSDLLKPGRPLTLAGVADGAEGLVCADLARAVAARRDAPATSLLIICRDGARMAALSRALGFFAPDLAVLEFPAWDCLPYDRVCGARRHHRSLRARHGRAGTARFLRRHARDDPHLRSGDAAHHRPAARTRSRSGVRIPAHDRDYQALPARLHRSVRRTHDRRHALCRGKRRPPPSRHGALAAASA